MTEHSVAITNFAYDPEEVKIASGDIVTWTNEDGDIHTATSSSGAPVQFDTGVIQPGDKASHTFDDESGTEIGYFCQVHPFMKAKIEVD